jgi:hypothetical protein
MALPENVAVRYTEDEAEYLSLRPVVRQTFRIGELVDMIVSVTGLDRERVAQILRSGVVVYHGYRYWWNGFEALASDMDAALAGYPVADASRLFDAAACSAVIFESSGRPPRHSVEVSREAGGRRRLFHWRSFWGALMDLAKARPPAYLEYSYARRADIYSLELGPDDVARLAAEIERRASRSLRAQLRILPEVARVLFVVSRVSKVT